MTTNAKAKTFASAKPVRAAKVPVAANPLRQADSRWQRTVRYGWDKGGAQGGRKS